jgi:hypothetical protein
MFLVLPLILLGISSCFEKEKTGFTALGVFLLLVIFAGISYFILWWYRWDGKAKCQDKIQKRQRRAAAIQALADDMDYLKVDTEWCRNEIGRIKDFASHLQARTSAAAATQMEEGRPMILQRNNNDRPSTNPAEGGDDEEQEYTMGDTIAMEDDERLSMYESCRSRPWRDVLYMSAGSIRSGPPGSTRSFFLDAEA